MVRKSQKRAGWLLAFVSLALFASFVALTAWYMRLRFPNAEHESKLMLQNYDTEALLLAVVLVVLAALLYFAFGRPVSSRLGDEVWCEIPDADIHPAVFGRLCRWNRPSSADFAATIIHLAQTGCIRVERGVRIGAQGREVSDFVLLRVVPVSSVAHPIDDAAMKMLFGIVASGKDSICLGEIHSFGRHHADSFSSAMRTWQSAVSKEVRRSGFFDRMSMFSEMVLLGLAVASALVGLLVSLGSQSLVPVVCGVASGAVAWFASRQMPRHTQHGSDVYARGKALHFWLEHAAVDDSRENRSSDRPSFDPELIPFAYVLRKVGIACEAYPGFADFCDELTLCIGSTAFAAESVVAHESLRALNSPVRGATLSYAGVTGLANPAEDAEGLFRRRV